MTQETRNTEPPCTPQQAEAWIGRLFELLDLKINAKATAGHDGIEVNLRGADLDRVYQGGHPGRSEGLSNIARIMQMSLSQGERRVRVTMSVGDPKKREAVTLDSSASFLATKATEIGESITVLGMNSAQRKAVHHGLRDIKGVVSSSAGQGCFRRITVNRG